MATMFMAASIASAQSYQADEASERISDKLLAGNREVSTTQPIASNSYLPFGTEYANFLPGNDYYNMYVSRSSYNMGTVASGNVKPDFDYLYVVSHGISNNPNELGVVYYVFYSKSQYQIVKCNTTTNTVMMKSDVKSYTFAEISNFTDKSFYGPLREKSGSDWDIFNAWAANDTRRNEVFQSLVDLNTMDYNNDGIDDLFLMAGTTLHIFNGKDLSPIETKFWVNDTNLSPSSVVYDFNGDGVNDYLCMSIYSRMANSNDSTVVEGGIYASVLDAQGNVSYKYSKKKMLSKDIDNNENFKSALRATMNMCLVYPEGKNNAPKLAFAVSTVRDYGTTKKTADVNQTSWHYYYYFCQQLTVVDFASDMIDSEETNWYSAAGHENRNILCQDLYEKLSGICSYYNRRRPFLFGKPALATAFAHGYNKPQSIFWIDGVYDYNNTDRKFTETYSLAKKYVLDNTGGENFDRIVGGQVVTITGNDAADALNGNEAFALVLAESKGKDDNGAWNEDWDWQDHCFLMGNVHYDETGGWSYTITSNTVNGTPAISITKINKDKGMQVELVDKKAVVSNPIINYVVSAAPYVAGDVAKYGSTTVKHSQTSGASSTQSYTNAYGGYVEGNASALGVLKISTRFSVTKSWAQSSGSTVSCGGSNSTGNSTGSDYVVFNYFPADRYTYVVKSCPSAPSLEGTTFCLMKARDNELRQGGLTVDEFNELVEGSSCPQITEEVLKHTTGDVSTYAYGSKNEASIRKAFGIGDDDFLRISDSKSQLSNNIDEGMELNFSNGGSHSESESFKVDNSVNFSVGHYTWMFGGSTGATSSETSSWSQSTSWNDSYSVSSTLPKINNPENNQYEYCMVWYKYNMKDDEGNPGQSFMVVNWYITSRNLNQEASAKGNLFDFDNETTGIDGVDNDKTVESVTYFDATGRVLLAPTKGLCMKVTTYTDGTKQTTKVMKK